MVDEKDGLSAEESAYFETAGEAPLPSSEPAPTEKVETAPEQKTVEEAARDEKGRFVPHQALHAEREEHKKTRAELNEIRERQARLEERWMLARQQEEQAAQQEFIPEAEDDPLAVINWAKQELLQRRQAEAQQRQQWEQQQQQLAQQQEQDRYVNEVYRFVGNTYDQVAESDPDLKDALDTAVQSFRQEFEVLGYRGNALDQQVDKAFLQFQWVAAQQMANGVNLADFVKGVAKTRGWSPKAAQQQENIKLPEQLRRVADAQNASRSVAQSAGRAGGDEMSLEQIIDMPIAEFEKWQSVPANKARFDRLMGA